MPRQHLLMLLALAAVGAGAVTCRDVAGNSTTRCVTVDVPAPAAQPVCDAEPTGACDLATAFALANATADRALTIVLATDSRVALLAPPRNTTVRVVADNGRRAVTGAAPLLSVPSGAAVRLSGVAFPAGGAAGPMYGSVVSNAGVLELERCVFSGWASAASGTGAMTSYASVSAAVVSNAATGVLRLDGTAFSDCSGTANSWTAMYTNADASFVAVQNRGAAYMNGACAFNGITASALAASGDHGTPIGGASAFASGGGVANLDGGVVRVTGCTFANNTATASASSPRGAVTATASGYAVNNANGTAVLDGAVFAAQNVTLGNGTRNVCVGCTADSESRVVGGGAFATCADAPGAYACQAHASCRDAPNGFGYRCVCGAGYVAANATACVASV